jgi:Putative Flp pilus-assembly TadE/G-like
MVAKSSERGAVLIMAAVALLCLVAFSAIVVDYGILWAARGHAQTAADAGALAGAQAIGEGEPNPVSRQTASVIARQSPVWGEVTAAGDIVVSPLPHPCPASAGGGTSGCIRVDVLRGTQDDAMVQHTNTLPVFFATMLGVNSQGVRATATAQAAQGNSVNCIKPWAVADKWIDTSGPTSWDQMDFWEPAAGDVYRAPLMPETNPTGFSLAVDRGMQLALKAGNVGTWSSGWTQEIDFPDHSGSADYEEAIRSCPSWIPTVGLWAGQQCDDPDDSDPERGCVGVKTGMSQGPTTSGVEDLIDLDGGAYWDNLNDRVVSTQAKSKRIVPIVLFHTADYVASGCSGTGCMVKVVNIMGFFVEGMCDTLASQGKLEADTFCDTPEKTVVGRLVSHESQYRGGAGESSQGAAFLKIYRLVR